MAGTPPLRRWQNKALAVLRPLWTRPSTSPLIASCPGSGKTIFGSYAARLAITDYGCRFILTVSPSVNVKEGWKTEFLNYGIQCKDDVKNETLRKRKVFGESLTGNLQAMHVTYAQLAIEPELFAEIFRRNRGLLIADEPHHADEKESYGVALNIVAESAELRLALTGTPFNSKGHSLSMVPSIETVNEQRERVRKAQPVFSYSYGDAIGDSPPACRPIEFITVIGRGEVEYKSLISNQVYTKVIDLAKAKKTDRYTDLLDSQGGFMHQMLETGISALLDIKKHDKRAAMLVAVSDISEGRAVSKEIKRMIAERPELYGLSVLEIFNDTPGAHERIEQLNHDSTDIVVAVRMISEGVNVPRLRVGVYATNCLTLLFFLQLVGRFVRWESRLGQGQFAKMIIPAFPELIEWARDVEKEINESLVPEDGKGGGGGASDTIVKIGHTSEVTGKTAIFRGSEEEELWYANAWFADYPELRGKVPDADAAKYGRRYFNKAGLQGPDVQSVATGQPVYKPRDLRDENKRVSRAVARILEAQGYPGNVYQHVNGKANKAAHIREVDDLTTDEEFSVRLAFLQNWLNELNGNTSSEFEYENA